MLIPAARALLRKHITSAETLDILMLLYHRPGETWTADSISKAVFTVPQAAELRLEELVSASLVRPRSDQPGAFLFHVSDSVDRAAIEALAEEYRTNRAAVVNLVFSRHRDSISSFSDAFKLRSD